MPKTCKTDICHYFRINRLRHYYFMLLRHLVDSVLITGGVFGLLSGLMLFGIDLVRPLTYSWAGVLFTFLVVFVEVVWNRL